MFGKNKLDVIKSWCKKLNIEIDKQVAYMGDDINNLEVLNNVTLSGCPNDAVKEVVNVANFISKKNGGKGSVRDFCDYILNYSL